MNIREMEDKISRMITQWEKEYLGRGSVQVKTTFVGHLVVVYLKGILIPAEKEVAKTREGMMAIKRMRTDLVESGSEQLREIVSETIGREIISFHTDLSTKTGERVIVFVLDKE